MIEFRPISKDDSLRIAAWRNNFDINAALRSWKQTNPEIQYKWLENISSDPTVVYYAIYSDIETWVDKYRKIDKPTLMGYCGLDKLDAINRRAEISLLINPHESRKGYGKASINKLLDIAFNYLGLKSVYGEVYQATPALKFWLKCGFKDCGVIPNSKFYDGKWFASNLIYIDKDIWNKDMPNNYKLGITGVV